MMQQVNLYVPELRPRRELLSAEAGAVVLASMVFILVAATMLQSHQLSVEEKQVEQQEQQLQLLTQQVDDLKANSSGEIKTDLDAEIAQLRNAIHNRQQIAKVLTGKEMGNKSGFSEYLAGISQAMPEAITLTAFSIKDSGGTAHFQGLAKKAQNIPLFFARLREQPCCKSTVFGSLRIAERDDSLEFQIGQFDSPLVHMEVQ